MSGGYFQFQAPQLRILPIVKTSEDMQKKIGEQVQKISEKNTRLISEGDKKTAETTRIQQEIKKIDAAIDDLVYEVYGITAAEKKLIEESLK